MRRKERNCWWRLIINPKDKWLLKVRKRDECLIIKVLWIKLKIQRLRICSHAIGHLILINQERLLLWMEGPSKLLLRIMSSSFSNKFRKFKNKINIYLFKTNLLKLKSHLFKIKVLKIATRISLTIITNLIFFRKIKD